MTPRTVEAWTWPLIFGGLLVVCLSIFVLPRDGTLGAVLSTAGGLAAAAGVVLIVLRSRMKDEPR